MLKVGNLKCLDLRMVSLRYGVHDKMITVISEYPHVLRLHKILYIFHFAQLLSCWFMNDYLFEAFFDVLQCGISKQVFSFGASMLPESLSKIWPCGFHFSFLCNIHHIMISLETLNGSLD